METSIGTIREIKPEDNTEVARLIRKVLLEMGAPKVGTAYADKALNTMYENYRGRRSSYFVYTDCKKILGGAGIAPLENATDTICELQKMYFLDEIRGRGLGAKMMAVCLDRAKAYGFAKVYLETMAFMKAAQKLYVKSGFEYIDAPMGNTGHYSCQVWMVKNLL